MDDELSMMMMMSTLPDIHDTWDPQSMSCDTYPTSMRYSYAATPPTYGPCTTSPSGCTTNEDIADQRYEGSYIYFPTLYIYAKNNHTIPTPYIYPLKMCSLIFRWVGHHPFVPSESANCIYCASRPDIRSDANILMARIDNILIIYALYTPVLAPYSYYLQSKEWTSLGDPGGHLGAGCIPTTRYSTTIHTECGDWTTLTCPTRHLLANCGTMWRTTSAPHCGHIQANPLDCPIYNTRRNFMCIPFHMIHTPDVNYGKIYITYRHEQFRMDLIYARVNLMRLSTLTMYDIYDHSSNSELLLLDMTLVYTNYHLTCKPLALASDFGEFYVATRYQDILEQFSCMRHLICGQPLTQHELYKPSYIHME